MSIKKSCRFLRRTFFYSGENTETSNTYSLFLFVIVIYGNFSNRTFPHFNENKMSFFLKTKLTDKNKILSIRRLYLIWKTTALNYLWVGT